MALPKRQNPGDEDFGSNREDCIKVYYEDLSVCTSYAGLHQLRLFAHMNTGNVANLELYKVSHLVSCGTGPTFLKLLTLRTIRPPDRQLLTLRTNQTSTTDTLDKFLALHQ